MGRQFSETVQVCKLDDGKRLSMRHGPIDIIIEADGDSEQVNKAYAQATRAFEPILNDLVEELCMLRKPLVATPPILRGEIAKQMHQVSRKLPEHLYITPMIAVAGAVADHVLKAMLFETTLDRAYVNNGGDIAVHLNQQSTFDIGICANIENGNVVSTARIIADDNVGGIATSGWRGRSHSFGIADAVTVLSHSAASADAAATLIANAIDLPGHPGIKRQAATEISPDSDLGEQLVTVEVGGLTNEGIELALSRGEKLAQSMVGNSCILAAFACLRDKTFSVCGDMKALQSPRSVGSGIAEKKVSFA